MKFVLLVEGTTERNSAAKFLKRWLDPQLKNPVGIQVVPHVGYTDFVRKCQTRAKMYLEGPRQSEIIAVIGLLDLYGPPFYPPSCATAKDRYLWGVSHFEQLVGNSRFRMFFAVHEFEAWLLSQPDIFPRELHSSLGKFAYPEQVNFSQHPSKLLAKLYLQCIRRSFKKTTDGPQLFGRLDPAIAMSKCPYLNAMLEEMLAMAKAAGL